MAYRYFPLSVIAVGLITMLVGCTSIMESDRQVKTAPVDTTVSSLENEVLVYGRIRWIQNGEERMVYKSSFGWNIWPKYLRMDDMKDGSLSIEADGTFTWKLARGTYLFHQIHWFDSWDGPHRFTPKVAFKIPDGANAWCIGTLVIDLKGKRDFIGGLWVKGIKIKIDDECDELANKFREHYSDPDLHHAKSLMIFDPHMADRPKELEEKDKNRDFLRNITPGLMTIY